MQYLDYGLLKFIARIILDEFLYTEVEKYETTFHNYVCSRVYGLGTKIYLPLDKEMSILPSDEDHIEQLKVIAAQHFGKVEINYDPLTLSVSCMLDS